MTNIFLASLFQFFAKIHNAGKSQGPKLGLGPGFHILVPFTNMVKKRIQIVKKKFKLFAKKRILSGPYPAR